MRKVNFIKFLNKKIFKSLNENLKVKNMLNKWKISSKRSWDVFRLNPWANEILLGLLGCDLIAFHTNTYAFNFLECCFYVLGARIDKKEMLVEYGNKTTVVRALPIGIPYDWFERMARDAPKPFNFKEKVILGVDRLDYTKGTISNSSSIIYSTTFI